MIAERERTALKVFLTGGTGFIGGVLARKLRERGDEVKTLVRDPKRASKLADLGCELVVGDLANDHVIQAAMVGCDAAIHSAAVYKVGMPEKERQAMFDANVLGTERVMKAALRTEIPKVVYISTANAFGNTGGEVADETHVHDERYVSYYDETKHKAHKIVRIMIDEHSLPAVIVQPGLVYGPGDKSETGNLLRMFLKKRLPVKIFPETGVTASYIDDVADGILLALDKGQIGEAYVIGGEITSIGALTDMAAKLVGRKTPRFTVPTGFLKATAPTGRFVNPLLGFPPNMKEIISASVGVTYWASSDKAKRELGYSPRSLEDGMKELLAAEGYL